MALIVSPAGVINQRSRHAILSLQELAHFEPSVIVHDNHDEIAALMLAVGIGPARSTYSSASPV